MSNQADIGKHEELDLLLPWYVNGTLDRAEQIMMERHVSQCERCRRNAEVLRRMQAAVNDEVPTPMVPRDRIDELIEAVVTERAGHMRFAWLTPRSVAAGIAIVMAGAFMLLSRIDSEPGTVRIFETATSTQAVAATDYVFAIAFEPGTSPERRGQVINAMGGTEIGSGDQPDTYRVAVSVPAATLEELAGFTDEVAAQADVVAVRVVAVQLPVE